MNVREAVAVRLKDRVATVAGRVTRGFVPQSSVLPCCTIEIAGEENPRSQLAATTLRDSRLVVRSWGETDSQAAAVDAEVYDALQVFAGTISDGGDSLLIHGVIDQGATDDYLPPQDGSDRGVHGRMRTFRVWHYVPLPT